jgi:hypothetical protein
MRHVAPLSLVPSIDCAYFLSPRGCTPYALQIFCETPGGGGRPFSINGRPSSRLVSSGSP